MRPGANGTVTLCPAFFAACSTAAQPPRTIRSASETRFLPPDCDRLKSCWIFSRAFSALASSAGSLTSQFRLRRQADPRPVRPAALVGAAEAGRRRPGGGNQPGDGQSRCEDLALEGRDVLLADQVMSTGGTGSCHNCGSGTHGPR